MAMTDDEARGLLERLRSRQDPGCDNAIALAHALVALTDRAALVERLAAICERKPLTVGETSATSVLDAARRHMKGEP